MGKGMGAKRVYSVADVKRSYSQAKAHEEWFGDWASALIYRPISFQVTPILIRLSVSATAVTIFSLLLGLSLPFLVLAGGRYAFAIVAVLATVWVILDCVDGNIARVTGSASRLGHYLDFVTDVMFRASFYCAIGLLADEAANPGQSGGMSSLSLSIFSVCVAMAARFSRMYQQQMSGDDVYSEDGKFFGETSASVAKIVFSFLSGIDRLLPAMVLAAGLTGRMEWVVMFLVIYSVADFIYTQYALLHQFLARKS